MRLRKRQQKQRWSKARRRSNENSTNKEWTFAQRELARKVLRPASLRFSRQSLSKAAQQHTLNFESSASNQIDR